MSPLISVLTTAYNREAYLAEAIESVLASTFTDFEYIIVDDASTDRTVDIAQSYTSDKRVRVYVNETNLGDYPNRNRAASYARGRYLKYLDSDDEIYSHGLATMVAALDRFPEAGFALCRLGEPVDSDLIPYQPQEAYRHHLISTGLFHAGPSGSIIRADAFRSVGGFTAHNVAGDIDLWLRLGARYEFVSMPAGLVHWRTHPGQEYRKGMDSFGYSFLNYKIAMDALNSSQCPLKGREQEKAVTTQKYLHAHHIWRIALLGRELNVALRLYRDSRLSVTELARGLVPVIIGRWNDG